MNHHQDELFKVVRAAGALSALLVMFLPSVALAGEVGASTDGLSTEDGVSGLTPAQERKVAGEAGVGVGLGWAHAGLGLAPELLIDVGMRIRLKKGAFAVHVRGGWQRYTGSGSGSFPCEDDTEGPCISSDDGNYTWELVEHAGRVSLPLTYRLFNDDKKVAPFVTVAPGLYLLKSKATSYGLSNTQFSAKFGIYGALGALIRLGPGGLFFEAGYQWSGLDHIITGDSNVGALRLVLGYRFQF